MANEITGKTGTVTVATGTSTTTLNVTGWSVEPTALEHRTDNTGGSGYSDRISSIVDCKFTVEANYDSVANVFVGPPVIVAGSTLTDVKLYMQGTASAYFYFPSAKVLGVPLASKVDDLTKYTINGANKGTFSYPSGTFTASLT